MVVLGMFLRMRKWQTLAKKWKREMARRGYASRGLVWDVRQTSIQSA